MHMLHICRNSGRSKECSKLQFPRNYSIGVAFTTPWLSRMLSSPGCARCEAMVHTVVFALHTCWDPCTRKAARNSPLLMPPPALPWRFDPSVYHKLAVGWPL